MKKIALLLAVILCLPLAACGKAPAPEQSPQESNTETTNPEGSAQMGQSIELAGPWHLDGEKNDPATLADRFPGYGEWGAGM